MIAVVLPTRGLVFTEVEQALEDLRSKFDIKVYRSRDLPIPDGHNQLTQKALLDRPTHILFIEEDTVPTPDSLEKLLGLHADAACLDYGVSGWGCVTRNIEGKILWCGLGCTLVDVKVFDKLEYPYFRADKALRLNDWTWRDLPKDYVKNKNYGGLDIWFFSKMREKGFTIQQAEGECKHLQLEKLGEKGINAGLHIIVQRPQITNKQVLVEGGEN